MVLRRECFAINMSVHISLDWSISTSPTDRNSYTSKSSTNSLAWSTGVWGDNVNKCGWDVIKSDTIRFVDFEGVDTKTRWPPEEDVWEDDEDDDWVENDMHCNMHNCSRSRALHRFLIVAFIAVLMDLLLWILCTFIYHTELGILFFSWHQDILKIRVPRTSYGALTSPMKKVAVTIEKSWMSSTMWNDS